MGSRYSLLLFLIFTPALRSFSQNASNDFFPLVIGNRWTYNYSASDWDQLNDISLSDSGTGVYTVLSRYSENDSTIWGIMEVRNIIRRENYFFDHGRDTSYAVKDSTTFELVEHLTGDHTLLSYASNWRSVFFLNSRFTDSTQFHRFFPAASQDTFTLVHKKYHQALLLEAVSISYQRTQGITKLSYSAPGVVGDAPKSNHTLKSALLTIVDNNRPKYFPERSVLEQNFPNPFNPITTIPFHISRNGRVVVQIYDILGRLLTTLLDDEIQSGSYSLTWNATNQSSGTYICVMRADGVSSAINIALIK